MLKWFSDKWTRASGAAQPSPRMHPSFPYVEANLLEVRDIGCLMKAMKWETEPIVDDPSFENFNYLEDLNERRIRDAEVAGAVCRNVNPQIVLEIGTGEGITTALLARNAPGATIYTVNIPPEEISEGGRHVTAAYQREQIGRRYREQGLLNVKQIYANTAVWSPDFGPIDVAYIDGCHDAEFVFGDTQKVLARMRPGGFILWHDFSHADAKVYSWVAEVLRGVEMLYARRLIKGRILHLRDSWVGLYRVPGG